VATTIQAYLGIIQKQTNKRWWTQLKWKNLLRYIFCPAYRRSCQIARYLRRGYDAQQALAKVGVIEA
jgi:hypothetical protein